jgi:predicted Zn finger-like uncharacterized protein
VRPVDSVLAASGPAGVFLGDEFGHNGEGGAAVIITCPNCSTGYLLPEHLVGPGGARVRCPRCQHLFAVGVDGQPREPAPATGSPPPERPPGAAERHAEASDAPPGATAESPPAADEEPLAVARAVLEQLALREGEAIERARAERRLFAEYGPALMMAYETYRHRAGAAADPSAFRTALSERWGVELAPLTRCEE